MKNSLLIKEQQKGLIAWFNFKKESHILYIGDKGDALAEYLMAQSAAVYDESGVEYGLSLVTTVAPMEAAKKRDFQTKNQRVYDYIICIELLEKEDDPTKILRDWQGMLKEDGSLILGMNNRLGVRFFCGDRDPYTDRNFDGIEAYRRAYMKKEDSFLGKCYAKHELEKMLTGAGYKSQIFYSVFSNLQNPTHIFSYGYQPKEDLANRIFPAYGTPETVFLEEEALYRSLIENDLFHQMANAYLVVAGSKVNKEPRALQVTSSMERSREDALLTIIWDDGQVEKKNAYPEGRKRLENMLEYADDLKSHGVQVLDMKLTATWLKMPFVDAPVAQLYLKQLIQCDKEMFLKEMDRFRDEIMKSSDVIAGNDEDELGCTFQYGYLDMIPLNCFFIDGQYVFYDQEFRQERYPANVILARMIASFYAGNSELQKIIPQDELYERYGLLSRKNDWLVMAGRFLGELRNEGELWQYHQKIRRNADVINSNRQSINYPAEDYYRLFINIFDHADTRKLILFGSGKFAKQFLELYGKDYPPYAIVDNQEKKWGEKLQDIEIQSPEIFTKLSSGEYKVIICIKNYISVMKQLKELGVSEYSIYDPARDYPRKRHPIAPPETGQKKYHIGYISGVFDLFHIGHVNLYRRAKEQCDYLIVGVVSDKGVIKHKGVAPFIPFEERIELVRSCRYVDEAVEIPLDLNGPKQAWPMYHYDVQFIGSDYINNQYWLDNQKWLREHGADLVFFPYTKSTNSTNIKALIEKKLSE